MQQPTAVTATHAENTRNATLPDLAELLRNQQGRKLDVVAAASALRVRNGNLIIDGAGDPVLTPSGVTQTDAAFRPTAVADGHFAEKLGIPVAYLRRMRHNRIDLYDANVNGLLRGRSVRRADGTADVVHPADGRRFLVRCFRGDGGPGIARAVLSDQYKVIDNLDALMAALDGIRQAGTRVVIESADLTDSRMYVRVVAPQISALAPVLLDGYRNPFGDSTLNQARSHGRTDDPDARFGRAPGGEPIVFAGFVLTNSETGDGAFTITPRLVVQVCRNGMTITKDAMRAVHLGSKLDEGRVRWSEDTQTKNLELITAKARDAVSTFLDTRYMADAIAGIERKAGRPVTQPAVAIQNAGKALSFSQDQIDGILDHFIRGGQPTAAGVVNAITSYAQTIGNADTAADMESRALKALDLIAA